MKNYGHDMNLKLFWTYITSLWLSIRLVLFEKYTFVLLVIWWLFAFIVAFGARQLYPGLGLVVVGLAFFSQKYVYRKLAGSRAWLIRRGDRIEFADDRQDGYVQQFEYAKVLQKMRGEDVAKTGLFEAELIPLYHHFYLVEMEDKNRIIPFEWILSLDFEDPLEED